MCHQHCKVCTSGSTFAGFVSELTLELLQSLIQLVLRHQIASVVAELWENQKQRWFIYSEQACPV